MAGFSIEVHDGVTPRLQALPAKIQRSVMRKSLRSVATKVSRRLMAGTPRKTGRAAKAVKIQVKSTNTEAWAKVKYKGKPAGYMTVYEYGSNSQGHHQVARPYFKGVLGGWEEDAKREFAESLKGAVEGAISAIEG